MSSPDRAGPLLETVDTRYFEESDWQHLRRLRDLLTDGGDTAAAADLLDEIGRGGRNGMVAAIESDVRGLYGLDPSTSYRYVPKDGFAELGPDGLRASVLARIDALRPGVCQVPESVYRVDIHTIECDGERIAVREIGRKDWDYFLYVTTSGPIAHYVEIDYGSHAIYSVVKRLTPDDSALLSVGALAPADIDRLVDRYR